MLLDAVAKLPSELRPVAELRVYSRRAVKLAGAIGAIADVDPVAPHQAVERQLLVPYRADELRRRKAVRRATMRDIPIMARPVFGFREDVEHHVIDQVVDVDELADGLVGGLV